MVILNIDDDIDDREMFCTALNAVDSAITCIQMESGFKALEYIGRAEFLPDYIFIDINMPKMDGYECVKAIRAIPKMIATPIVMYSTTFNPEKKADFAKKGIKHLEKSSRFSDLVYSIKTLISTELKELEEESKK